MQDAPDAFAAVVADDVGERAPEAQITHGRGVRLDHPARGKPYGGDPDGHPLADASAAERRERVVEIRVDRRAVAGDQRLGPLGGRAPKAQTAWPP